MENKLKVIIPEGVDFSDLKLSQDEKGIQFDVETINKICDASNISRDLIWDSPEDNAAGLIVQWYVQHLKHGGEHDPVADNLINEVAAEDALGDGISHKPGSA